MVFLLLLACSGSSDDSKNIFDTADTGTPECGRVRGEPGVLMYDAADQNVVYYPTEEPDGEVTTGVAGPVGDDWTFLAVTDGDVYRSTDAGCNWEEVGSLPATGQWMLRAGQSRAYAFDPVGRTGAVSDDLGASWTPMPAGVSFTRPPTVAESDDNFVRGLDRFGVFTTTDGGQNWTSEYAGPKGDLLDFDVSAAEVDSMIVATSEGVFTSRNGGVSWSDATAAAFGAVGEESGSVVAVAMSPASPDALAALLTAGDTTTLVLSADGGATWGRLADSGGVGLGAGSDLWFAPGSTDTVISHYTEAGAEFPLHLNVTTATTGTHTVKTALYDRMSGMVFSPGDDGRWIAGVYASGG